MKVGTTAITAVLVSLISCSAAMGEVPCDGAISGTGIATWYDFVEPGECNFTDLDGDTLVAAMNLFDFDDTAMCGRYVRVTGPQGTVDVRIVDCQLAGGPGDIDLNRPAFAQIAPLGQGAVPVTWVGIAAPDPGLMILYMHESSSEWWLAMQVRDHRYGVASLEYYAPGGYVTVPRSPNNFFVVDSGLGIPMPLEDPFTIRLTDVHGQTVEAINMLRLPGEEESLGVQFPQCVSTPSDDDTWGEVKSLYR